MNAVAQLKDRIMGKPAEAKQPRAQGFWLVPDVQPVVLSAFQKKPVSMKIDYDYLITAIMGRSDGFYMLNIRDQAGREFMNQPVHSDTIVGFGDTPHYVNPFFVLRGSQSVILEFTDISGLAVNNVYLTLECLRLMEGVPDNTFMFR